MFAVVYLAYLIALFVHAEYAQSNVIGVLILLAFGVYLILFEIF
jgi:hypothetical protein